MRQLENIKEEKNLECQWCYRQLMKISWTDKMRNKDVLKVVN